MFLRQQPSVGPGRRTGFEVWSHRERRLASGAHSRPRPPRLSQNSGVLEGRLESSRGQAAERRCPRSRRAACMSPGGATEMMTFQYFLSPLQGFVLLLPFPGAYAPGYCLAPLRGLIGLLSSHCNSVPDFRDSLAGRGLKYGFTASAVWHPAPTVGPGRRTGFRSLHIQAHVEARADIRP